MPNDELRNLANVGAATRGDLHLLGIDTVVQLAGADPVEMYDRLCRITATRHDPCVLDTFRAIVHEAKTGEKTKWWEWTKLRKTAR